MPGMDTDSLHSLAGIPDSQYEGTKSHDDDSDAETCGFEMHCGCCKIQRRPVRFLNTFSNAKAALFFISFGTFLQGLVVNGVLSIVVSTVEKRFNLRSTEMGFVSGSYDLGVLIALPVVTYIGGRGHKPLWLGWGTVLMGVGSMVFCLPHFIAPSYSPMGDQTFECRDPTESNCKPTALRDFRWFFMFGQFLVGLGACPLFTLGITYLDANVKQSSSSLYHGILFSVYALGPGVGYILGGYFLNFYTNFSQSADISSEDPMWIGNWWIGFFLAGWVAFLISIPMLMFPKQLPHTDILTEDREQEIYKTKDALEIRQNENFGKSLKDLPRSILLLLKNPTVMLISIAGAMDFGIVSGIAMFGPKYIEYTFSVSSSYAALCFGVLAIFSIGMGNLLGGYLVTRFTMTVPQILKLCIVSSVVALSGLFIFLLTCKNPDVAGVTVQHEGMIARDCTSPCRCTTNFFSPVCGEDGITYLSYCDAGCRKSEGLEFANCTGLVQRNETDSRNSVSLPGKCRDESCPNILYFLTIAGVTFFALVLKDQPALQASLRSVPFHQRSLAVGMQGLCIRVLGMIPIPVIIGRALDSSCLVWSEECGQCGSCKMYDNTATSKYLTAACAAAKAISLVGFIAAAIAYKHHPTVVKGKRSQDATASSDSDDGL